MYFALQCQRSTLCSVCFLSIRLNHQPGSHRRGRTLFVVGAFFLLFIYINAPPSPAVLCLHFYREKGSAVLSFVDNGGVEFCFLTPVLWEEQKVAKKLMFLCNFRRNLGKTHFFCTRFVARRKFCSSCHDDAEKKWEKH